MAETETTEALRGQRKKRGRGKNYWLFQDEAGRWGLDYRTPEGRRVRKTIGSYEDAKSERAKIETTKKLGTYVDENSTPTFDKYSEHYLANVSSHKLSHEHEKRLMKGIATYFGKARLSKITRARVREYRNKRSQEVSGATVNREIALLRHLFSVAIEDGHAVLNPARGGSGMKAFKEERRTRFLKMPEIEILLSKISARIVKNEKQGSAKKFWGYLHTAATVAVHSGMRKTEILGMRWDQIDWEQQFVMLPKTKNGDARRVPLDTVAFRALLSQRSKVKNKEYVFPSFDRDGKVVPLRDVKVAFGQALKDAGIADFRFHDLRHTFASHYMMSGGNLYTLAKILGHKDIKMTQRYADLSPEFIDKEKERLDSIWTIAAETAQQQPPQSLPIF